MFFPADAADGCADRIVQAEKQSAPIFRLSDSLGYGILFLPITLINATVRQSFVKPECMDRIQLFLSPSITHRMGHYHFL